MENLKISVAGIRGKYPFPLSPEIAYKFVLSFAKLVKEKKIFVCTDTRISREVLKHSVISALLFAGKNVVDMEISPTPTAEYIVEKTGNSAGVIITASHNPFQYNGIKFLSGKGTFLNERESKKILEIYNNNSFFKFKKIPGDFIRENYIENHFSEIYRKINTEVIKKRKFKVVIDPCQGVGALYTKKFLENLGCEVFLINTEPLGYFSHNPEPVPSSLTQLCEEVKRRKADIGFAQDPDCDRLSIVSEDGKAIGEEYTLVFCLENILEKKKGNVVVNLSTTSLIDFIAEKYGVKVYRTKIGEVNVVEKMKRVKAVIGGEGNGGVIWPEVHYGRDSFVGMALILEYLAEKGKRVSEVYNSLPRFYMVKKKMELDEKKIKKVMEKLKKYYEGKEKINFEDGLKILREDGWIHIRPSGTEPVLRIIIETKTPQKINQYFEEVKDLIF